MNKDAYILNKYRKKKKGTGNLRIQIYAAERER